MANQSNNKRANFSTVLQAIREDPATVFKNYARALSDLNQEKMAMLRTTLAELDARKKAAFFRYMDECSGENYIYDYTPIALVGVDDSDGEVRLASIHVLATDDSRETGAKLLNAAVNDPYEEAQVAAIEILGQYMYEADIENAIPVSRKKLKETLASLLTNEKKAVRRAAVVAYAISNDVRVKKMISGYLAGNDPDELLTALSAVHLSLADDWNQSVLELMRHENELVRRGAFRTAGSLQLREALPELYETIAEFDKIPEDLLLTAAEAVAEIGDESAIDVLEMLGEAAVDMDPEISEFIDDCIDTLNMAVNLGPSFEDMLYERNTPEKARKALQDKIDRAQDHCLSVLEEKIPKDLEDDEAIEMEEDECDCGDEHHHHHHHHHHDNPLEGMDLSRFRILDDLEAYEASADHDEDEEALWAEFESLDEEDLDAESLRDFMNKLEKKQAEKKPASPKKTGKKRK